MRAKTKRNIWKNVIQFLKLQVAGNILFWGTYVGYAIGDLWFKAETWVAVGLSSIIAHVLFFVVDKNWVFSDKTGKRKTSDEIVRFAVFMGFNYLLNLGIIVGLDTFFHISPYVGQFISGFFFTVWTWVGLKFWVFRHVRHARYSGITIETRKTNAKRYAKYQRLKAKQKTTRAA